MDKLLKLFVDSGFANLDWTNWLMFIVAGVLVYLAIKKHYEPLLLIPISFGIVLANFPLADMGSYGKGIIGLIYEGGIKTELLPPLIFLGVGVLTDFRPLLSRPITFLLGAAAQIGIFISALGAAYLFGFSPKEAASIGIIGGADGPTYMSLVPILQPPVLKLLTSKKERAIDMPQAKPVSRKAVILFPMLTGAIASLAVPSSAPLIGMLMFGNLIRESGVTDRLKKTAGGALIDIVTIFLGIAVGATMEGYRFLQAETLMIFGLGAVAFIFSTAGGITFAKFINLLLPEKKKINPCIGAAGVSAVPMAARVVQDFVSQNTDGKVNPIMAAMGPNVAGVIGSAVAAGVFLTLLS
jgi:oxaloacetate decarboxylase beta subunit